MKSLIFISFIALLGVAGLVFGIRYTKMEEAKALENEAKTQLAIEKEASKRAEDERKAKEAEARKSEADKEKAEAALEKAKEERFTKEEEKRLLEERNEEKKLDIEKSKKEKELAEAQSKKNKTEKERLEAEKEANEEKRKIEESKQKQLEAEKEKAEANLQEKLSAERTVKDALKKAELETARVKMELEKAKAERLMMYKRAQVSRAELIELEKAEKALAREEMIKNGILPEDSPFRNNWNEEVEEEVIEELPENITVEEEYRIAQSNETAKVEIAEKPSYVDVKLEKLEEEVKKLGDEHQKVLHDYYRNVCRKLIKQAEKEGRKADAEKYKRVLWSLLSDPMSVPPDQGKKFK